MVILLVQQQQGSKTAGASSGPAKKSASKLRRPQVSARAITHAPPYLNPKPFTLNPKP